jgi:hypothetical protein
VGCLALGATSFLRKSFLAELPWKEASWRASWELASHKKLLGVGVSQAACRAPSKEPSWRLTRCMSLTLCERVRRQAVIAHVHVAVAAAHPPCQKSLLLKRVLYIHALLLKLPYIFKGAIRKASLTMDTSLTYARKNLLVKPKLQKS